MNILNYKFKTEELLFSAITHTSVICKEGESSSFERMEFLGDSILGLIIAESVFEKFPDYTEGELSKLKAKVVSRDFLSTVARKLGIGRHLILSSEAERSGGRDNSSILADAMEAIICAIYLDGDLEAAREFITTNLFTGYREIFEEQDLINYKSRLQEFTQLESQELPEYNLIEETGPDHDKTFVIEVEVNNTVVGSGEGHTKKEAQQKAAKMACKTLKI
ncbi:MAG: ribonuclease III [Candidatus Cloacimonetes bacterium]|nr:ribonuclease III [Candidatus Cloacimonadota bacterium]